MSILAHTKPYVKANILMVKILLKSIINGVIETISFEEYILNDSDGLVIC
jgi:hypothetical protein